MHIWLCSQSMLEWLHYPAVTTAVSSSHQNVRKHLPWLLFSPSITGVFTKVSWCTDTFLQGYWCIIDIITIWHYHFPDYDWLDVYVAACNASEVLLDLIALSSRCVEVLSLLCTYVLQQIIWVTAEICTQWYTATIIQRVGLTHWGHSYLWLISLLGLMFLSGPCASGCV